MASSSSTTNGGDPQHPSSFHLTFPSITPHHQSALLSSSGHATTTTSTTTSTTSGGGPSGYRSSGTDLFSLISSAAGPLGNTTLTHPSSANTPLPFSLIAASGATSGRHGGSGEGQGTSSSIDPLSIDDFPALSNVQQQGASSDPATTSNTTTNASSLMHLVSQGSAMGSGSPSLSSGPSKGELLPSTATAANGSSSNQAPPKRLPFHQGGGLGSNVFGHFAAPLPPHSPSPPSKSSTPIGPIGVIGSPPPPSAAIAAAASSAQKNGGLVKGDKYGLFGLIDIIRMSDQEMNMFALGLDLTSLGLSLSESTPLSSTLMSPFAEIPSSGAEPPFLTPPSYFLPTPPPSPIAKIAGFSDETLFYIFYCMPRDVLQEAAAQELYNRAWRFHKELRLWLSKDPGSETFAKGIGFERGLYIFFDPLAWCRVKKEWLIYYDQLEERDIQDFAPQPAPGNPGINGGQRQEMMNGGGAVGSAASNFSPRSQQPTTHPNAGGGFMYMNPTSSAAVDPTMQKLSNLAGASSSAASGGPYHHPPQQQQSHNPHHHPHHPSHRMGNVGAQHSAQSSMDNLWHNAALPSGER